MFKTAISEIRSAPACTPVSVLYSVRHAAVVAALACVLPASAAVVISQVYGGGGNSGATIKNDFIELFNNGTAALTIGGWTVQYASATGTSWQTTLIPAGTSLPAGTYFLIKQAQGAGGTIDITPDLSGTIALSGTNGKVALVGNATALVGAAPAAGAALDVGLKRPPTAFAPERKPMR